MRERPPQPFRLLLASASPRRRALLEEAGIAHEVVPTGVDDGQLGQGPPDTTGLVTPAAWVSGLAYFKARGAADVLNSEAAPDSPAPRTFVLAGDTVCVVGAAVIGQPRDAAHARAMIRSFVGREHDVLTGVCLIGLGSGARAIVHDRAVVRLGRLDDAEIHRYVASESWRGKAGAYNFFERRDAGWPLEVDGDPQTVVGLPIRVVRDLLARHGFETSDPSTCHAGSKA
ncbi:MAG: Maf family protein [Phycisphaerales bacterium]|nr:Maf family protein [Phycisphaerales bacterium]